MEPARLMIQELLRQLTSVCFYRQGMRIVMKACRVKRDLSYSQTAL